MMYCEKIVAKSAEDAFHEILGHLSMYGRESSPRGHRIVELQNVNVVITNPRNRIVGCKERRFSAPYAFGELAWYLSGNNNLDQIAYYSKFQEKCSDDGETLNSAYGARIFGIHPNGESFSKYYPKIEFNQWEQCVDVLRKDPDSRQAIIHLHTPNNEPTKDEVCTLTLQFLIRDAQLNMITTMRSNDVVFGFVYDVFAFTVMQELMANELGVELGYYCHNVGSMHIYTKEYYGKGTDLLLQHTRTDVPPMQPIEFEVGDEECDYFLETERHLREIALSGSKEMNWVMLAEYEKYYALNKLNKTNDEFVAFMLGAFLVKMHAHTRNYKAQCEIVQKLRDCGFEFVADICALFVKNALNGAKLILEGADGTGKTYIANKLLEKCLQKGVKCDIIHYVNASDIFDYECGYTFHLQNGRTEIFDRFVFSELVYSKVYGRKRRISKEKYDQILQSLKDTNTEIWICVAVDKKQQDILVNRRNGEDDPQKLLQLNHEYIKLVRHLKWLDLNVCALDIYGNKVNEEQLKW